MTKRVKNLWRIKDLHMHGCMQPHMDKTCIWAPKLLKKYYLSSPFSETSAGSCDYVTPLSPGDWVSWKPCFSQFNLFVVTILSVQSQLSVFGGASDFCPCFRWRTLLPINVCCPTSGWSCFHELFFYTQEVQLPSGTSRPEGNSLEAPDKMEAPEPTAEAQLEGECKHPFACRLPSEQSNWAQAVSHADCHWPSLHVQFQWIASLREENYPMWVTSTMLHGSNCSEYDLNGDWIGIQLSMAEWAVKNF